MTTLQMWRNALLLTTRPKFWMPLGGFRNFLDESIPEQVAKVLRTPYTHSEITSVLIDGWRWKNTAIQIGTEEIERAG